jgi:hypothetical protein
VRKIFGLKREEVKVELRRIHQEEFYELCSLPNIILMIKSIIRRWAGNAACMWSGEREGA